METFPIAHTSSPIPTAARRSQTISICCVIGAIAINPTGNRELCRMRGSGGTNQRQIRSTGKQRERWLCFATLPIGSMPLMTLRNLAKIGGFSGSGPIALVRSILEQGPRTSVPIIDMPCSLASSSLSPRDERRHPTIPLDFPACPCLSRRATRDHTRTAHARATATGDSMQAHLLRPPNHHRTRRADYLRARPGLRPVVIRAAQGEA